MATSTGLLLACPAGKEGSIGIHRCRVQILGAEPAPLVETARRWVVVTLYNLLRDVTPAENFLRRRAPEVGGCQS
jgi:hypothetical protein